MTFGETLVCWDMLNEAQREFFETQNIQCYANFKEEHKAVQELSNKLWNEKVHIEKSGDFDTRVQIKRISPYRVYKRETAA